MARKLTDVTLTPIGLVIVEAIRDQMSREQLAYRAGLESGTLSKLLRGLQPIGEERLERLRVAAGVSTEEYARVWLPALTQTREAIRTRRLGRRPLDVVDAPYEPAVAQHDEPMPAWFRPFAEKIERLEASLATANGAAGAAEPPSFDIRASRRTIRPRRVANGRQLRRA